MLSDFSVCLGHETEDTHYWTVGLKRVGEISGYKMSGIHQMKNRTIGLDAFEWLDLVVTKSVIH